MTDQYAQSRSGIARVNGAAGDAPHIPGAVIGDTGGAMGLALGIMTALAARELYGVGQRVRSSSYGVMVWMQGWELNHSSVTGTLLGQGGGVPSEHAGDCGYLRDGGRRGVLRGRDGRRGVAGVLRVRGHTRAGG